MLVENHMTTDIVTLAPDQTLLKAMTLMQQKRIRHLPVVDGGRVVGIVTELDIRRAGASDSTSLSVFEINYMMDQIKVANFMTKKVITVGPEEPIEVAAKLIYDHKIGALPVVENGHLVGLISNLDILETFIEVLGIHQPSVRIELELENRIGALADTTKLFKELELYLVSAVTLPEEEGKKTRGVVFRVSPTNENKLKEYLRTVGPPIMDVR
ncbi:MAG: CBS and ACT domain-containing protein [Thermodesulfobacteriota bacterium]